MKLLPRLQSCVKWTGLLVCVLIAVAFAFSTKWYISWTSPTCQREVGVMLGGLSYGWRPEGWSFENNTDTGQPGWTMASFIFVTGRPKMSWWIIRSGNRAWESLSIPLWMPFLFAGVPTTLLWYRDRHSTRRFIDRFAIWLAPKQSKKLGWLLVVAFSVLHAVFVILGLMIVPAATSLFLGPATSAPNALTVLVVRSLFFGSPVWGVLWAWIYVRLMNRLRTRVYPDGCAKCGYDLTGNVSGVCPECGTDAATRLRGRCHIPE